ncbi:UDP-N-acetylmuramoyl-L-alanyl-D-glutamate--2,6-diaminopimelate ligase [Candidatus Photodesmus katoptron]|uniref:UDP-N-acetylmuramoyl-L-alanyl-D-glutamate--2,6-diaminopimelate ligase n=1 Tax=Candidatus Photodesmus katoptron Akat1 TaxID=1236703 RepID=S3DGY6_9GAMM|nr:UDP-N-acetylmuramoyl-L-alanyl-D-glutamate--2,6-diaminopimelate ligase [Candidatus Photodesmus katoptron]EPE37727.1 UDP-N-acetylmuramoyl-L-alanyl-D-glutamate--2,6-diaminopimelate ligase [Candidatus Photodesmus katoptron Akat1]KEY90551.1 UDP-N-acetylmuramoyl-L-alanyl-D-glutamate--2,6-diaminopimelate ligase [Candidatus Photodesmus katoptron]
MNAGITLSQLIFPWVKLSNIAIGNLPVHRIELDSRKVMQGDTFIALIGHCIDARKFIPNAIYAGATIVLAQSNFMMHGKINYFSGIPIIYIKRLNICLSELAGRLYHNKSNILIGITGTNGKTTISQLIAQWLGLLGKRAAVMGTIGNGFLNDLKEVNNTTSNAIDIQRTLSTLEKHGTEYTALELSSHGLVQGRVRSLKFAIGIFSNLSHDHLDYHSSMQEYKEAKFSLFVEHDCQLAVINADDKSGADWLIKLPNALAVSLSSKSILTPNSIFAKLIQYFEDGIKVSFSGKYGNGELLVPLIGRFNAENILLAFSSLLMLGFDKQKLLESAPKLLPIIGRMELFKAKGNPKIIVDYAHTPDGLKQALLALRVHYSGKLWLIFGCSGERDKSKRSMMAKVAEKYADKIILTDDNPRSESPDSIITDILKGLEYPLAVHIEHNRYKAISFALNFASKEDIIFLAGKGHETHQVFKNSKIYYSDRESARKLLGIK